MRRSLRTHTGPTSAGFRRFLRPPRVRSVEFGTLDTAAGAAGTRHGSASGPVLVPRCRIRVSGDLQAWPPDKGAHHFLPHRDRDKDAAKGIDCFESNKERMRYDECWARGMQIRGGQIEPANKAIETTRMIRSGQSWGRDGGQGVLTFRSLLNFGRFDGAWVPGTFQCNTVDSMLA